MKKVLFSLIAVATFFVACGPSPVAFNDAIVNANTNITKIGEDYQNEVSKSMQNSNFADVAAQTDSALVKINAEIDKVKALEVPKGGDAFKEAAVNTYESLRDMVEIGRKFGTLTAESDASELNKIVDEYNAKMEEYTKHFNDLSQAQMDFAEESNYEVR
ncbi:hypothetical protein [Dysgonomonas sp. 511]|uniref:hypothetical protein n=1 Tax=Dysgonomonas sp. 511 TaxID=2302930 RepID=UPI0013D34385|nr:hypothetical protein [Dysgonomonas sp. 511]NDV79398.1 hypothetical protein [Dysgonomonas sp. 511]